MSIRWTNNATSVLASDITAGSLSMTVTTGHGDRFPEVVAPHYCMVTLIDTSGNREIVKVTARASASNTLTITRAQEGTSARSFAAGSLVELRITKNAMDEVSKAADINAQHYVCDASAADQGAATNSSSLKSLVDSLGASEEATIDLPHTGTGDTTTYTVGTDLTIPATVTLRVHKGARISPSLGKTLTVDGIVQAGAYRIFAGDGTVTVSTYPQDQSWWGNEQRLDGSFLSSAYDADLATLSLPADTTISAYAKTLLDDATALAAQDTLAIAQPVRDYSRGLVIKNNASNPNYQVDIDADEVMLQDTDGKAKRVAAVDLTADVTASGANGLDTGSEAADTWYYIWVINNGTTTAGLLSASATSPTMPSGYTFKALVGAIRNNASSNFIVIYQSGRRVTAVSTDLVSIAADDISEASIDASAHVPATAKKAILNIVFASSTTNTGQLNVAVRSRSGVDIGYVICNLMAPPNGYFENHQADCMIETAQTLYYLAWKGGTLAGTLYIRRNGWEY